MGRPNRDGHADRPVRGRVGMGGGEAVNARIPREKAAAAQPAGTRVTTLSQSPNGRAGGEYFQAQDYRARSLLHLRQHFSQLSAATAAGDAIASPRHQRRHQPKNRL